MTTTATIMIQIDVLTSNHSVCASFPNAGLSKSTMSVPLVMSAAQPPTMNAMARVVIRG